MIHRHAADLRQDAIMEIRTKNGVMVVIVRTALTTTHTNRTEAAVVIAVHLTAKKTANSILLKPAYIKRAFLLA